MGQEEMIRIDGAAGEGGGQVVRSALGMSLVTGRPVRIDDVRGRRSRPGLLRQHLAAVQAAAEIGHAEVEGAELGARTLVFRPRRVRPGDYRFAVGTAGSALLVLQAVLPALLLAPGPSRLALEGGTHKPWAPPYPFVERAFLPLLERMGARVRARLVRPGFYPAGGGRVEVEIEPVSALAPLDLVERGPVLELTGEALVSALPKRIGNDEVRVLREALGVTDREAIRTVLVPSPRGPGNAVHVATRCAHLTEVFSGFGRRGVHAEQVAREVVDELLRWRASGAPVGPHLADQLVIPLALAGAGRYRTTPPTRHTRTNLEVVGRFVDVDLELRELDDETWEVSAGPAR